jgi:hypothetical protein
MTVAREPLPWEREKSRKPENAEKRRAQREQWQREQAIYRQAVGVAPGRIKRSRPPRTIKASAVTITRADGTISVQQPYSEHELLCIAPDRPPISDAMRQRILRRDGGACRYCGKSDGPFHMDHVLPVSKGGRTNMRNLVTACETCNLRKGAQVWTPTPLTKRAS